MTTAIQEFQDLAQKWEQTRVTPAMQDYCKAKNQLYKTFMHCRSMDRFSDKRGYGLDDHSDSFEIKEFIKRKFNAWMRLPPAVYLQAKTLAESVREFERIFTLATDDWKEEKIAKEAFEKKVYEFFDSGFSAVDLIKFLQHQHTKDKVKKWFRLYDPRP